MSERRKYKRVDVNVAIKGKLIDPQKRVDLTGDILLKAKNLNEGGALLEWPRSWNCESCSNCLGWVHNSTCKLKEDGQRDSEFNKELVPGMHITIHIVPGNDIEPVSALAKVSWVMSAGSEGADNYNVGVSFIEDEKQEPDIKKKILVIKKTFETS